MIRLTPRLTKASRSLLGWSQTDLAKASGVSISTIGAFESKDEGGTLTTMNNKALVEAFEAALIFIPENGGGAGVRLKKVETVEAIAHRIEVLEAKAASIPEPSEPSPETGMNIMRKAAAENELVELRHKRKRLRKAKPKSQTEDAP